jgi:cholesterol oxidase
MKTIDRPLEYYDYVIIGSGFGGSISALRLTEKGYSVLVIEKGKKYEAADFPATNWKLSRWLWLPSLRFFGFFKMTFFRYIGVLSGVGVGGGSLVYANTLARPEPAFFRTGSWSGLADWENELKPWYDKAEKMLGAAPNPVLFDSDNALKQVAEHTGRASYFSPTTVSVFFGEPEIKVPDPYFNGEGPEREGCRFCGGCMTGCRYNAKNTLDRNYLYLAASKGAQVLPENRVVSVIPAGSEDGSGGYRVFFRKSTNLLFSRQRIVTSKGVIFSGGVLGTVRLLLDLKRKDLPGISKMAGRDIRTNNESLVLVDSTDASKDFSKGVAIGSIFSTDENSHLEAVRYGSGSGFWKTLGVPLTHGKSVLSRIGKLIWKLISKPASWLHIYFTKDFAKSSVILLFMQHLDSTLRFKRGLLFLRSGVDKGKTPTAFMAESKILADEMSKIINGKPFVLVTEAITGIPTTAHILGGAVIGANPDSGVIDSKQKVYGYKNMLVCDGSAISANPGVNPSLTISAMTERAMSFIPQKKEMNDY